MYDELAGNLRAQATHFSVHDETSLLLLKAADAIEKLSRLHEAQRQNLITLMNEDPEMEWIPVTERLPERNYNCLVCDDGVVLEGYMNLVSGWYDFLGDKLKFVTHWMPLPEPPKADKDGET